jgi:predicted Zn-dependent protease
VSVGATWSDPQLHFKFLNSTADLTVARQRNIIREAFSRWAEVSALQFIEVDANHESELFIAFHGGSHGDSYPFDDSGGPDGNTLAHAFFPPPAGGSWAGSMHFDDFESWKDQPGGAGTRLYNVALHEIGHLLGLQHSQDQNAIMYAYYAEDRNDLRADDIAGAQDLYGGPTADPLVLSLGDESSGHLARKDAESHYQVTVQNKLIIKLDGPAGQDFDLFVRYGKPVERNKNNGYDQVSWGVTADEVITVDNPQAGTYYILVHSYRGSGSYSLQVETV